MNAPTQGRAEVREESKSWHLPATIGGLLLLLAVAAWLRILYLRGANLHVDEFTTLWAAQQVREQGAPIMPSGVLYTRGLLYTYLLAGAETLFGAGRITAFALSMVTGLITIVVTWIVGKRSWSAAVGWLGRWVWRCYPRRLSGAAARVSMRNCSCLYCWRFGQHGRASGIRLKIGTKPGCGRARLPFLSSAPSIRRNRRFCFGPWCCWQCCFGAGGAGC